MLLHLPQRRSVSEKLTPDAIYMLYRYLRVVEWADLVVVDMSKLSTPDGRAELMAIVRDAMHTDGFMYLVNHGLSQAQVGPNFCYGAKACLI